MDIVKTKMNERCPVGGIYCPSEMCIRDRSRGSDGGLNHYLLKDKPSKSVWRHSGSLEIFDSYDDCKADLMKRMVDHLSGFVKIV